MDSSELMGKWLVRSTRHLINLTETLICRNGARLSVAEAEGFSKLHQRAAALIGDEENTDITTPSMPSTLICHNISHISDTLDYNLPFELQANTAQQAIEQCVLAHDIAARLNMPGICTVDDQLSDELHFAHLPQHEIIRDITPIQAQPAPATPTEMDILREIQSSFDLYKTKYQFESQIIHTENLVPNGICFITTSRYLERTRALTQAMRSANLNAGIITLNLIRPFPALWITDEIKSQKTVIIMDDAPVAERSDLMSGVRAIQSECADIHCQLIHVAVERNYAFEKLASKLNIPELDAAFFHQHFMPVQANTRSFIIGAAPNGDMSSGLLIDLASYLAQTNHYAAFHVKSPNPRISTLGFESASTQHSPNEIHNIDILFLSHPGLIDIHNIIDNVNENGIILVLGRSIEEASIWPLFSTDMKISLEQKKIKLYSISGSILDEYQTVDRYGSYAIHGALLSLIESYTSTKLNYDLLKDTGMLSGAAYNRIVAGKNSIKEVDRTIDRTEKFDPYFAPQIQLPRMLPSVTNKSKAADWRSSMRNFFVRGQSNDASLHPLPGLSIRPALLNPYLESLAHEHYYPLLATRYSGNPELQTKQLDTAIKEAFATTLSDDDKQLIEAFVLKAEQIVQQALLITPAKNILKDVLNQFSCDNGVNANTYQHFCNVLNTYIQSLPDECYLLGLNSHTLLDLYVLSVRAARRSRMRDVRAEIRGLITQLRDALRLDDANGPYGMSVSALKDAFGMAASELLNTEEIAHDLEHRHIGHKQHDPDRILRMTESLRILEQFHTSLKSSDDLIFVYPPEIPVKTTYDRVRLVSHREPIALASGMFDAISQQMVEAFKAMRMARLDIDNAFDPNYHGDILDHFTWQDLSEEELRLMPVICIAETTVRLYGQLTPLSKLIRSGKPLDVLVFESTSKVMRPANSQASYDPGFSYMATAYREAFVAQSTLARPSHLVGNLNRMNRLLRPAIHVVACPTWSWRLPAKVQLEAAFYGRTAPIFQYDPSIGETRVECFNVDDNPMPDQPWPTCEFTYLDENNQIQKMEGTFTFAHALALEPGYHKYFRIIPNEAWNNELIEIGDFLKNPSFDQPKIPFIWGVIDSTLRKCIMTRDVANACIDRMQRWKTLRELSMSTQAQLRLASESRESRHAQEIEASQKALSDLTQQYQRTKRLLQNTAQVLSGYLEQIHEELGEIPVILGEVDLNEASRDETAFIEGLAGDSPVTVSTPEPQNAPVTPAPQDAPAAPALPVPRIESDKCLSCGACVGLNDKIFGFNENDQAILINPDATPDDCREAADTCPAACIIIQ